MRVTWCFTHNLMHFSKSLLKFTLLNSTVKIVTGFKSRLCMFEYNHNPNFILAKSRNNSPKIKNFTLQIYSTVMS